MFIPYEVASLEAVMHGLYLIWWVEQRHISPATVAMILAAGDLAITAIEIPTGWFADRFGCPRSLIVGSFVQVAGLLCCWLGEGVPGVLSATLLVALGDGFRSGADQALLYRSCARLGRDQDFQKIAATARSIQLAAMVGLVVAGGAIVARWGFGVGWLTETSLSLVGLIIAWAMVEPPALVESGSFAGPEPGELPASSSRVHIWAWLALAAPAALVSGAATATAFWAQTTGGTDPRGITVLVATITVAEALGSLIAARMPAHGVPIQVMLAGTGAAITATVLVVPGAWWSGAIALAFLLGLSQPLRAAALQRLTSDGARAQAASIASVCDKVCDTMALMLAGFSRRRR